MDIGRLRSLSGKYAIAGVGYTVQGRVPGRTALSFYLEAAAKAMEDGGLKKEDVDGLILYRRFAPLGGEAEVSSYLVAQHLGITPRFLSHEANCERNHIAKAISLLEAGFCSSILLVYGDNALSGGRTFLEEAIHGEGTAYVQALGMRGPMTGYALSARRAMNNGRTGPDTWAEIAVSGRAWAQLNPRAMTYGQGLTLEGYFAAPVFVDPFRIHDACLIGDGGRACVITSLERAKDLRHPPVAILGVGMANPSRDAHQALAGDPVTGARESFGVAAAMADISRGDIDAAEIYDCFTCTVETTLEGYGYFASGEGKDFFRGGRTGPLGEFPVNTSGGLLAEGYHMGLTPLTEAVMQLMGRCGEHQIGATTGTKSPGIVVVSDNGGVFQTHSTVILGRG